jgi:hypothetical protein
MVIGTLLGVLEDRNMVRLWVDDMLHREEGQTEPTEK